jgi:hypothetical protein
MQLHYPYNGFNVLNGSKIPMESTTTDIVTFFTHHKSKECNKVFLRDAKGKRVISTLPWLIGCANNVFANTDKTCVFLSMAL